MEKFFSLCPVSLSRTCDPWVLVNAGERAQNKIAEEKGKEDGPPLAEVPDRSCITQVGTRLPD